MSLLDEFEMPQQEEIAKLMQELSLTDMDRLTKLSTKLCGKKNPLQIRTEWAIAFEVYRKSVPMVVQVTTSLLESTFARKLFTLAKQDVIFGLACEAGLWKKR